MHFDSLPYFALLVGTLTVYWVVPARFRLWILLAASYGFYASWSVPFIALIVCSTTVDYLVSLGLAGSNNPLRRRRLLTLAIGTNLAILGLFKYANFFIGNAAAALDAVGLHLPLPVLSLALPLGISFYTFEAISYVVDVYRGMAPVRSYRDYALYIMFFPHLIAGPIIRSKNLTGQFAAGPKIDPQRVLDGLFLLVTGLICKCVLADNLSPVVDAAYAGQAVLTSLDAWLAAIGFSGQIFFDFAGYTALARGSALLFGFDLPRNFDDPYLAPNITAFWQRWHMSLSSWLRDYLYIPLGGSHHGTWLTYRNLMITMGLGGLWHGASWQFLYWGLFHGSLLIMHRAARQHLPFFAREITVPGHVVGAVATFLAWTFSMVLFRAPTMASAINVYASLVGHGWAHGVTTLRQEILVSLLLVGYPVVALAWRWMRKAGLSLVDAAHPVRSGVVLAVGVMLWALFLPDRSPLFIYFQF